MPTSQCTNWTTCLALSHQVLQILCDSYRCSWIIMTTWRCGWPLICFVWSRLLKLTFNIFNQDCLWLFRLIVCCCCCRLFFVLFFLLFRLLFWPLFLEPFYLLWCLLKDSMCPSSREFLLRILNSQSSLSMWYESIFDCANILLPEIVFWVLEFLFHLLFLFRRTHDTCNAICPRINSYKLEKSYYCLKQLPGPLITLKAHSASHLSPFL